jgi:spore coat polysaccharide biosynthesis protein SpsF
MFSDSPRIGIISQARMTSTRLPGKVLLEAAGHSLLHWHVARLRAAKLPVLLAITTNTTDDVLATWAAQNDIPTWRGPEDDVLARYQQTAAAHQLDVVVRVTSDCPLIDGALIADGVKRYLALGNPRVYLSNCLDRSFPRGFDFEIFSRELLEEAAANATRPEDREHVTPYLHQRRAPNVLFESITRVPDRSHYRLTVDTADDFTLISRLLTDYQSADLSANSLIALLDAHPELVALNAHIEQKKL